MKKFFTLFTLLVLGASAAHAQADPGAERKKYLRPKKDDECQYVQNVTKNTEEEQQVEGTYTRVAYRPYSEMLVVINELKKMNNWADSTYQRHFNNLPAGGTLVITMHRKGAKNADPSLLTVTATTKDGKQLLSQQLTPGTGRFWNRDLYMSTRTIPFVKTDEPGPVQVSIADDKLKQRFDYIVVTQ
ncbi:hypothetical protein [Hymenobacter latericus]|uniref:hypothetical protein n=1 Tax=Hymenobacter sp. YIM 151858-1 TaxID=2987688 RepID=UPI0022276344|nr:hypothetical protein [Hymenobacter sp. YIM 151858-1]UYZ59942.1 hypothetical protein OIS50_03885 [Hymenobacter sp. YIM 151858-1]